LSSREKARQRTSIVHHALSILLCIDSDPTVASGRPSQTKEVKARRVKQAIRPSESRVPQAVEEDVSTRRGRRKVRVTYEG
jgi:hypothetical protein